MKKHNPFPHWHQKAWSESKELFNKKIFKTGMLFAFIIAFIFIGSAIHVDSFGGLTAAASMASMSVLLPLGFKKGGRNFERVQAAFAFKTDAEIAAEKKAEEMATLTKSINDSIAEKFPQLKEVPEFVKNLKTLSEQVADISKNFSKEKAEAIEEQVKSMGLTLKSLSEKGGQEFDGYKSQIKKFIGDNKENIKSMYKKGNGMIELELKAVGNVGLTSGSIVGSVPQYPIWGAPDFNLIGNFIDALITVSSTNMPNYPYTEMLPKDGDYSFLTEGEIKPEMDFKWETRYQNPLKVAAWERLSEEVAQDVPRIEALANELLLKKHNIKKQRGIISGDGISPNPKGLTEYGRAYSNPADLQATVTAPNIFDVINACIVDIATTHNYVDEMPYSANIVLMNTLDYYKYIQTPKDGLNRPLFDYFPMKQNNAVGMVTNNVENQPSNPASQITIVPTPEIPVGKILVCDGSKYNSINYIPYTVRIGWINDDFIKNQFVILAESRFFAFVKKLDEVAFIYDDIATILADIEITS